MSYGSDPREPLPPHHVDVSIRQQPDDYGSVTAKGFFSGFGIAVGVFVVFVVGILVILFAVRFYSRTTSDPQPYSEPPTIVFDPEPYVEGSPYATPWNAVSRQPVFYRFAIVTPTPASTCGGTVGEMETIR